MPRYPSASSLPPLSQFLPDFAGLSPKSSKLRQVAELLRPVIQGNRGTHNITFYSTRDIARFFGTSQNTANLVVKHLEGEGLLRRVRGSLTAVLGTEVITHSRVRAVAGFLYWGFAQRFSETHHALSRVLGDILWPHHIALDTIHHYDVGEVRPDLDERLRRHALDFAIWPFPFRHHRDHLMLLQDRGVRNLVIGPEPEVEGKTSPASPDVIVEFAGAYRKVLEFWKEEHGIRRVLTVEPREFTPRGRIEYFATLAAQMGFESQIVRSSYQLPGELVAREKKRIGIALLDEHSTAEFVFYAPSDFVKLLHRHRILFGNNEINIPFVPHGVERVDRIFIPIVQPMAGQEVIPEVKIRLAEAVTYTLVQWSSGDFSGPPLRVPALFWRNGKLWRYL